MQLNQKFKNTDQPFHYGTEYSSKTLDWMPSDSEEIFYKNMQNPERKKYLESKNWHLPGCFTYKMNNQGFRTKELAENKNSAVALGCSFTVGIGLPIESVWPSLVSQAIKKPVYNLGVVGASLDTIFRIADYWIPVINPSAVILLIPPTHRFEVCKFGKIDVYSPMDKHEGLLKHWFAYEENEKNNARRNLLAIQYITDCLGIPLHVFDSRDIGNKSHARDFLHQGQEDQADLAANMLDSGVSSV